MSRGAAARLGRLACALVLALALGGCKERVGTGGAARPDTVRVGYMPFLSSAPLMIADQRGFFREEGIEVELMELNANDGIVALATGNAEVYANFLSVGLLNAVVRGADLAIVADKGSSAPGGCFAHGLVIRAGLERERDLSSARGLQDLRAGIRPMTSAEYVVDRLLKMRGAPRETIEFVSIPTEATLQALHGGLIDMRISSEPEITQMRDLGIATPWLSFDEIVGDGQWGVIAYGKRLLRTERGLGVRFLRAYLRGVRAYREGKTEDNVRILAAALKREPDLLRRACWPAVRADGQVSAAAVADFAAWARERGYAEENVDARRMIDARLVREATAP